MEAERRRSDQEFPTMASLVPMPVPNTLNFYDVEMMVHTNIDHREER
jgi:hypothetical protein